MVEYLIQESGFMIVQGKAEGIDRAGCGEKPYSHSFLGMANRALLGIAHDVNVGGVLTCW
jgi:hypothetical protein